MASYLEQEDTHIIHPEGFRQLYKRFFIPKDLQLDILLKFGTNRDDISKCSNAKEEQIYTKNTEKIWLKTSDKNSKVQSS